jgi:hypothetical protein
VGYDVSFVQIAAPTGTVFPLEPKTAAKLVGKAAPFADPDAVRKTLLKIEGTRPGPKDAIDYLGRGLSYARLTVRKDAIHVENNCSAADLLKIFGQLVKEYPSLLILDLQSNQIHNASSYKAWWSKPL